MKLADEIRYLRATYDPDELRDEHGRCDPNLPTKMFTVSASPDVLERFEKFLAYVQYCSGVGHSCDVRFPIDGDGADRFHVAEKLPKVSEENERDMEVQ